MMKIKLLTKGLRNTILTQIYQRTHSTDSHVRSAYAMGVIDAGVLLCRKCDLEIEVNTEYCTNKRGGPLQTKYYHPICFERLLQ